MRDVHEQAAVLALVSVTQGKWHQTATMIEEVGSGKRFLRCEWTGFESFDVREAENLVRQLPPAAVDRYVELIQRLSAEGVKTVTVLDDDYPVNLRAIFNRPPMLFIKGRLLENDERAVAVVGTREASEAGITEAHKLASELAGRGITVLSGLARGIDTAAHEGALTARGRTVAVIGTGIHKTYPPENAGLAKRVQGSGALVSQFWPDAPPRGSNFPLRNVVMSGMAVGTVVVEAGPTSGARMQARLALEHGKRVFLLESLVMKQQWARKYEARYAGVTVVKKAAEILDQVEQLVRPPKQLTLA
jgi:DNA processing protein